MTTYAAYHVMRGALDPTGMGIEDELYFNQVELEQEMQAERRARESFLANERTKVGAEVRTTTWGKTVYEGRSGWKSKNGALKSVTCGCWFTVKLVRTVERNGLTVVGRRDWRLEFDYGTSDSNNYTPDILDVEERYLTNYKIRYWPLGQSSTGPRQNIVKLRDRNALNQHVTHQAGTSTGLTNGVRQPGLWYNSPNNSTIQNLGYNGYYEGLKMGFNLRVECAGPNGTEVKIMKIDFQELKDARDRSGWNKVK